jgi:hypothetical protein
VKLTIRGDEVTFDFSDSDEQRKEYQFHLFGQPSAIPCAPLFFFGTHLSSYHNEGSLADSRDCQGGNGGSLQAWELTAASPAITGGTVIEAVLAVMSMVLPDRSIAPYAKLISPILVGRDKRDKLYIYSTFSSCAGAGLTGYDGYQNCCDLGTLGSSARPMPKRRWSGSHGA